jgi:hypothetical protein
MPPVEIGKEKGGGKEREWLDCLHFFASSTGI